MTTMLLGGRPTLCPPTQTSTGCIEDLLLLFFLLFFLLFHLTRVLLGREIVLLFLFLPLLERTQPAGNLFPPL
jgi:hypothetical protein